MAAPIDRRVLTAGLTITIPTLLALWADHYPAYLPYPETCPGCGHSYVTDGPLCPTAAIVRPLLRRRRHQVPPDVLLRALTFGQYQDLTKDRPYTEVLFPAAHDHAARPADLEPAQLDLFATPPTGGNQ